MRDVSVHVFDLGQVLLCYLDQLRAQRLLRELGGAVLLGGRVLIVVPVLLQNKQTNNNKVRRAGGRTGLSSVSQVETEVHQQVELRTKNMNVRIIFRTF